MGDRHMELERRLRLLGLVDLADEALRLGIEHRRMVRTLDEIVRDAVENDTVCGGNIVRPKFGRLRDWPATVMGEGA